MVTLKKPARLACLLLTILLSGALLTSQVYASEEDSSSKSKTAAEIKAEISEAQNKLNDIKADMKVLENNIAANKNVQANARKLQEQHNASIQATENLIQLKIQYIDETTAAINQKMAEITQKQEEFDRNEDSLKSILVAIYEINNQDPLAALVGVESFSDLLTVYDYTQNISTYYVSELERILGIKQELQQRQAELEVDLANLEEERQSLEAELEEYQKLLDEAKQQESEAMKQIWEDQAEMEELAAEREKTEQAIEDLQKSLPTSSGKAFVGGQLTWPVPSHNGEQYISSYYGSRMLYGQVSFHKGIDIATQGGEPIHGKDVVAALSGTVIYVDNAETTTYGKYLILDHGGGIRTVYAHCSAIYVSTGQSISEGQTIAAVGNTGRSTGPHLHFEIRHSDTQYINPLPFFRGEDNIANYVK